MFLFRIQIFSKHLYNKNFLTSFSVFMILLKILPNLDAAHWKAFYISFYFSKNVNSYIYSHSHPRPSPRPAGRPQWAPMGLNHQAGRGTPSGHKFSYNRSCIKRVFIWVNMFIGTIIKLQS